MKLTKPILLGFAVLCLAACTNNVEKNNLSAALTDLSLGDAPRLVLVLEQSGCSTCLYKADEFFLENKVNENILYVFTGHSSLKRLKLKYDITGNEPNIIIDHDAHFYRNNVQLDYPSIIYLNEGKIERYELGSSDNFSAYSRLFAELNL
jgi:hypothetical protein